MIEKIIWRIVINRNSEHKHMDALVWIMSIYDNLDLKKYFITSKLNWNIKIEV